MRLNVDQQFASNYAGRNLTGNRLKLEARQVTRFPPLGGQFLWFDR